MRRSKIIATIACLLLKTTGGLADERLTTKGGDQVVIRPLAHASVRVDFGKTVIYVDPWSRADLTGAPPADLILISDADAGGHHLDTTAIEKLRKSSTVIVMPASGKAKVPDGVVLANGDARTFGAVRVESIGSYDMRPGEPFHAKGVANGYLVTVDGLRILFAGVTECVPEISSLKDLDVAFMPMNLPNGRMTIEATAACVAQLQPKIVYPYHYDQGYIARLSGRRNAPSRAEAAASVRGLATALAGRVEVRELALYPEN